MSGGRRSPVHLGPPSIVVMVATLVFVVGGALATLGPPTRRGSIVAGAAKVDAPAPTPAPTTTPTARPTTTTDRASTTTPTARPTTTTGPARTTTARPPATSTPPASTTTQPPAVAAETITIAATGEILPHPSIVEHARRHGESGPLPYDFGVVFADLRPLLERADVAICHLEVPVAPDESQLSGYPVFGIPADVGPGIAASGWDRCSTASNHSNDKGTPGIVATIEALDGAGVGFVGTARSPEEAATSPYSTVEGVVVAHFSYTWGFNGAPPDATWMTDVIDPDRIRADASRARSAGADLVVVSLHWGVEYDTTGTEEQRRLATELLASPDIDLLIGHGPHVVQPVFEVDGEYALLSVGNLVANQGSDKPRTYDGMVATITFSRDADGRFVAAPPVIAPTWYDRDAGVVRAVDPGLVDAELSHLHGSLQASRDRTAAIVGDHITPG